MKHEHTVNENPSFAYQIWLAGLGLIEILRKQSGKLFKKLIKEGKDVEARNQAAKAPGQAKESSLVGAVVATKEEYQKKLEAQLEEWDAQLDQLRARAQEAQANVREKIESELENLKAQRAAVQAKLDELRNRSENAWEDLRDGVEKAWSDLGDAMSKVVGRFK
jgi:chromosome segregation ATPase